MPVLLIASPDCGHEYQTLAAEGSRVSASMGVPELQGTGGEVLGEVVRTDHPWAGASMDACCG